MMMGQQSYVTSVSSSPECANDILLAQQSGHTATGTFPDLTRYNEVHSFNLPAQADSSLLTPNSASPSPHCRNPSKFDHQYPTPPTPATSLLQEPSPPDTSTMYTSWNSGFNMNGQSTQSSSSPHMASHQAIAPEYLNAYSSAHDGRRTPGPPEPYMGSFGVSDSHSLTHSGPPQYYGIPPQPLDAPGLIRSQANGSLHPDSRDQSRGIRPGMHLGSNLAFRQTRRDSLTDSMVPNGALNGCSRGLTTTQAGRVRKSRRGKRQNSSASLTPSLDQQVPEHHNCHGEEVPPDLKSGCPEEERCLFASRWKHRHARGNDMWDAIQTDYERDLGVAAPVKETLQMKFKRGRSKYIQWLPRDDEILHAAWRELEKERYEVLLDKFISMGGSKNMLLNATDMECKVVNDLKLEEGLYMDTFRAEDLHIRRRIKANPPKKRVSSAAHRAHARQAAVHHEGSDEDMIPSSQRENNVIDQTLTARSHEAGMSDSVVKVESTTEDRWGPGIGGMMGVWDDRQPLGNSMPPPGDHLLRQTNGQSTRKR